MKVFISSTFEDLKSYRQAATEVVKRYKGTVLAMEYFMSQSQAPQTVCDNEVRECDIFVGIYAHRFGFVPDGEIKSITQQEYELAKKLRKDCLCFIIQKGHPWIPDFIEFEKKKRLNSFLDSVKKERVLSFFTTVSDFEIKLSTSLGKLIANKKGTDMQKKGPGVCIPIAPTPYIAHPYPLPEHFTGRDAERAVLSNWWFNETQPMLVMEAIGGMGKSALSWVWLHQEILERSVELDGVFWWSFYDASFESFLRELACYVTGNQSKGVSVLSDHLSQLQAALHNGRFLLILDGLERALRAYSGMEAMFIQEKGFEGSVAGESEWDKRMREPVHPMTTQFLQHLASNTVKGKTLVTSRLLPMPLEGLAGVRHFPLTGLSPADAVRFLRTEEVKGNRAELEQAGKIYEFHPLMLKLLASSIRRSRTKDIKDAFRHNLIDQAEPRKILIRSFNLLTEEERQVASSIAVFRGIFTFNYAKALFPGWEEDQLWQVMQELRGLGFLFYDEKEDHFDFHPIMRSFLYNQLTSRTSVHTLAVQYFKTIPKAEKIISLDDLTPVIELFHHLVKAGKFDEADQLFYDRIENPTYFQLPAYHLRIELLKELFPDGEDRLPRLKDVSDQAGTLVALANTYALASQPAKAVPLYLLHNKLREKDDNKKNLAIGLGNVAYMAQIQIGQISASITHLRKENFLGKEIDDKMEIASSHQELGHVLTYQGRNKSDASFKPPAGNCACAEVELNEAFKLFEKEKNIQWLGLVSAYRSFCPLLQSRLATVQSGAEGHATLQSLEALEQARKALTFAEDTVKTKYPYPPDFFRAYWLLGEALIQCRLSSGDIRIKPFEIHFYDEYFQQPMDSVLLENGKELAAAERCLNEALRRCHKVNLVALEPDLLLAHARLEWAKGATHTTQMDKLLQEAMGIAQRSGYRLKLTDIHLFCGQLLLDVKQPKTILGLTDKQHLQKTKEYALDVSEFSHLYQSDDPHFYDNIPEYQMLKRGMTHEERIRNGYWVAYQIAEALGKKIEGKEYLNG